MGNYIEKIQKRRQDKVYVVWEKTSFEDEMSLDEAEPFKISEEVSQLKFSDGMVIHTHGPMRVVEFSEGWYVVGEGKLISAKSDEEAKKRIEQLRYTMLQL